jgi:AraC family transcriptional regulator
VERPEEQRAVVEAELRTPLATTWVVHFDLAEPADDIFHEADAYWLDLCLTPRVRNSRACYPDRWIRERFARIGNFFLVPPGEVLHARSDRGRQTSIVCQLHAEPIHALLDEDLEWSDRRLEASLDIPSVNLRSLVLRLGEEARRPGFASEMMAQLITGQLAIELFRFGTEQGGDSPMGGLAPWRLRIIDERLAELRSPPTLSELAALCDLSVRQLTRGFRASRGSSIGEYVAQTQIERAKRLLATDESIKSIAHSLGFASPAGFSSSFRRATGQAPRQFRQIVRVAPDPG